MSVCRALSPAHTPASSLVDWSWGNLCHFAHTLFELHASRNRAPHATQRTDDGLRSPCRHGGRPTALRSERGIFGRRDGAGGLRKGCVHISTCLRPWCCGQPMSRHARESAQAPELGVQSLTPPAELQK